MTACERVGDVNSLSRAFRSFQQEEHVPANETIYGSAISCRRMAKEPQRAMGFLQK
jgi:hypothetical protein